MNKINLLFVVNLLFVIGCDYHNHDREDKYAPFPNTEIIIHTQYAYDKNHIGTLKNTHCYLTIKNSSENPVRVELWTSVYGSPPPPERKIEEISLKKSENATLQLDKYISWNNGYEPFYRIECYSSIGGILQSKTIKYRFISLDARY